ncbi:hypothetical protein KGF56_002630 [Candida oxycetoniae]|uniref:Uncharacterized protein n=1 Tax=Candida oxycetoniae TaxID=497107 RepID=A0AAI9SXB9_9ASCO|nr:uncharacterized protein KGF56_002630 [Candida oxycetoniae]KAI3404585.2 hypothetical protein KGF56_002630 [Candida oxycetoniae]
MRLFCVSKFGGGKCKIREEEKTLIRPSQLTLISAGSMRKEEEEGTVEGAVKGTVEEEKVLLSPQNSIDTPPTIGDEISFLDDEGGDGFDAGDAGDTDNRDGRFGGFENSSDEEEEEEEDMEDMEEEEMWSEHQVKNFVPEIEERPPVDRRLSRADAESIVGGESISNIHQETKQQSNREHPVADPNLSTEDQQIKVSDGSFSHSKMKNYNQSQKVFSFALPFGGLETIKHNLTKQLQNFKIDVPFVGNNNNNNNNNINSEDLKRLRREVDLKLERQQTISTLDDENYFRDFKGTDAGRLKAIKHSISANVNEIIPHKKKGELHDYETIYDRIDGNIVVMGGYRGSILRDTSTKKRVWIPIKAGFNLRKINLLLGPNKEDELNAEDKIYPDGVLKNVGPVDICKKLINKLDANPNVNIQEFGYDWRLSGDYVSHKIEKFLEEIYKLTGKPTLVIAHSMGGLMVHGALQRNPKLFRSVIYVGSPSECLNILGPIRFGDSVILSDKILTYETNFMMRSSFIFLPLSGEVFYNKDTKENYKIDYFDPDNWVEYNLNPLVAKKRKIAAEAAANNSASAVSSGSPPSSLLSSSSTLSFPTININQIGTTITKIYRSSSLKKKATSPSCSNISPPSSRESTASALPQDDDHYSLSFAEAYRYLSETLKATKRYVLSLEYNPELEAEYPPMAIVYGNTIPSVRGSIVRSREDIKNGNYYEFFYGHGDGVIHQKWLMPEKKGFKYYDKSSGTGQIVGKFASSCAHVGLMTDHDTMGKALNAVFEAEKFWEKKKQRQREKQKGRVNKNLT